MSDNNTLPKEKVEEIKRDAEAAIPLIPYMPETSDDHVGYKILYDSIKTGVLLQRNLWENGATAEALKSISTENELRELNEGLRLDRNMYRDAWEDRQQEVSELRVERDRYKEALDSIKNHCITFPFSDNNDIYEICTKTIDTETTNTKQS